MTIETIGTAATCPSIDDLIRDSETFLKKLKNYKKAKRTVILGFTIVGANGYFRGIRSINATTYSVHLGKKFDPDDAQKKIATAIEKMPEADREYITKIKGWEK